MEDPVKWSEKKWIKTWDLLNISIWFGYYSCSHIYLLQIDTSLLFQPRTKAIIHNWKILNVDQFGKKIFGHKWLSEFYSHLVDDKYEGADLPMLDYNVLFTSRCN